MLSSASIISQVASCLREFPQQARHVVVDPVMISTSGSRLLAADAIHALVNELLPVTYILTPNVPEAEILLSLESGAIQSVQDMRDAAKKLAELGPKVVLLKGGHLPMTIKREKLVVDVVYDAESNTFHEIQNDFVETKNTHGTGCTLSAALAGYLAKGVECKNYPMLILHNTNILYSSKICL